MARNIASRKKAKILEAKKKEQNHLGKVSAHLIWWSGARFLSKIDVLSKLPPVVHEDSYTTTLDFFFSILRGDR